MAARGGVVEVTVLGNTAQLESALERSGVVAQSAAARIKASYAEAGEAAAKAAAAAGASADEQADAAGRAAAAALDSASSVTKAQQVAADAAARAAAAAGLSADAQVDAAKRAAVAQAELEDSVATTGARFESTGNLIQRTGQKLEGWGIPFAGGLTVAGTKIAETDSKAKKFSETMSVLGGVTLVAATAAFAGVAAEGVHLATDFQKSMAMIAGNSDIPVAAADKIGDAFLNTAGYMTMSGNEMAKAFAPVAGQLKVTEGAALSAGQALQYMKVASDLAEGSQTDLVSSTAALTQVMQSFHLSLGQASTASDLLFNVSRSLNVPITQVGAAIDKLHGRLGILMPSMSDVGALMIALGQHGIMGSRGIQVAQTALTKLTDGSQNTQTVLDELGVHIDNSQGKFIGMANVINQLRPALADLNQKSQEVALTTLFGSSAWQVMGQIIGAGVPRFQQATDAATKLGTAHKAAAEQAKTLDGQIKILVASLEDIATKLGMILIPVLESFGQALASTINWMEQHKAAAEALAAVIAGPLALAVGFFVEQRAAKFVKSIQSMMSELQKLGNWILSGSPQIKQGLDTVGASGEAAGANVAKGMATAESSMAGAVPPLEASSAAAGAAIEGGIATGVAGAEGAVVAAKPALLTDGAADGAVVGTGMLSGFARIFTGAAILLIAGEALKGPLNDLSNEIGKATGGALGNDITSSAKRGSVSMATAEADARKMAATGIMSYQQALAGIKATGAIKTGAGVSGLAALDKQLPSSQTNPQQFMAQLEFYGLNKNAAAGIAGNVGGAEDTSWNANTWQAGSTPGAATSGYGLVQWSTASYHAGLAAMAKRMNLPASSATVQEAYLISTLSPQLIQQLNASPNAAAAAKLFEGSYENPKYPQATALARQQAATAYATGSNSVGIAQQLGGYGPSGTESTGSRSITSPTIAAASQKTVDAINTAFTAAVDKYSAAAKSATSGPIKVEDEKTAGLIAALKVGFDAQASTLSGPALEALKTTDTQILQRMESNNAAAVKRDTIFEQVHLDLTNQEKTYKSAAQSATSSIVAKLDEMGAQEVAALLAGFHSTAQDATMKERLSSIEKNTSARVAIGGVAGGYQTAALSASSPLLAQLDEHFAQLLAHYATGAHLPAGGVVGRVETQARVQTALGGRGSTFITGAESNLNSSSYQTLVSATDKIHKAAMDQLVKELQATHRSELETMAKHIETDFHDETTAAYNIMRGDTLQIQAANLQKQTTDQEDAINKEVTSIKDMAQTVSDAFAAAAQNITDTSQIASDAASGQATVISDQAQSVVDTLGERGLWGLNLVAQQMQVAADNQKTAFDQQVNLLQQSVDSITKTQDALVAQAQQNLDNTTTQQDAALQLQQAHLDAVTATENAAITAAQGQVNQGVVGAQAELGKVQGQAAAAEAAAAAQLQAAQNQANTLEANANSALTQAQGAAQLAIANANAALANAQNVAQTSEAQSAALIAIEKEEAATQFAGSGMSVYITGISLDDAAAVASEVSWVGRSQFSSPLAA